MSGTNPNMTIDIIISKLYNIQAFSNNKEYTDGFVGLIGGYENCIVVRTKRTKINLSDQKLQSNMLYEVDDIWSTENIDYELDEYLQERESNIVGCFHQMMGLLEFYKFTEEENKLVDRFVKTYDYNFLRDCHGLTAYDYKEYLNLKLLLRMYLSTIKRTK